MTNHAMKAVIAKSLLKNLDDVVRRPLENKRQFYVNMIEPGRFSVLYSPYSYPNPSVPYHDFPEDSSGGYGRQREIDVIEIPGKIDKLGIAGMYYDLVEQAQSSSDPASTLTEIELRDFLLGYD